MRRPVVRLLPRGSFLLLVLFIAVLGSAITVSYTAYWNRQLLNQLNAETTIRDKAQAEWGRLVLERSTWTSNSRVEALAAQQLHMRFPAPEEIRLVAP